MNTYYTGTSAYKLEQYEEYTQKRTATVQKRKAASRAQQAAMCKFILGVVVAFFVASSALVYVNVMALRATTKIEELEKKLALEVDKNKQKELEINRNLDMKVIEEKAVTKLGMQKLDNSQIVYINVKKGDYSEAVNANNSSKRAFGGVKKLLMGIKEYFS